MSKITRRNCLQGTLAALGAAGSVAHAEPDKSLPRPKGGIKFAEVFGTGQSSRLKLAAQLGVNHAILTSALMKARPEDYVATLEKAQAEFKTYGITIEGVESHPVPAEKIKLGLPGRDEEIENYKAAIVAMGKVGIPVLCYNWMAGIGWYRTRTDVLERGGALTSEFDLATAQKEGLTQYGEISEEKIWSNLEYFLKAVIPVAEKARVKMALHPDDPPLSPLRGIGRILTSAKNYRRVMDIAPSPINGITFCQANFRLMGEDIGALAKEWCRQKKIFSYISATWRARASISVRRSTTTAPPTW